MPSSPTGLDLPATPERPRRLCVELSHSGYLYVCCFNPDGDFTCLASASAPRAKANLHIGERPTLHVGGALFPLTAAEAAEIERVFGPLGLRVHRS
jgi:hypothetical protein